jgi:hypothetical protein
LALGILLSGAIVQPVFGVSYVTGLKVGDSALYSLSGSYAQNSNAAGTRMKVTNVDQTRVSVNFTDYPSAGFKIGIFWIDVLSGQSNNFTNNLFFAVASGLKAGDPIFDNWANFTVSNVQTSTCGGLTRSLVFSPTNYLRSGQYIAIAWDQNTGVMCRYASSDLYGTLDLTLDNTTLWTSGTTGPVSDPYTTAANITAAVGLPTIALIAFVFFRRRRARR